MKIGVPAPGFEYHFLLVPVGGKQDGVLDHKRNRGAVRINRYLYEAEQAVFGRYFYVARRNKGCSVKVDAVRGGTSSPQPDVRDFDGLIVLVINFKQGRSASHRGKNRVEKNAVGTKLNFGRPIGNQLIPPAGLQES